jgi:hypothetical protein
MVEAEDFIANLLPALDAALAEGKPAAGAAADTAETAAAN